MASDPSLHSPHIPPETQQFISAIRDRIAEVVVGQDVVVERTLIALLTSGHILLQGVPGLAKTLLVSALANTIDLSFKRIQFTVDLLPSDIVGSEILDQRTNEFHTHRGPIFTNLLLADEINRAAPKVQSAAARGHAGAQSHDWQRDAHAAGAVSGDRHAKPDRAGGHLRVARGAARSLHALPSPGLSAVARRA